MTQQDDVAASRSNRWGREASWLGPTVFATVLTTVLLAFLPDGANLATVLAVPIGVVAIVIAVLALRPGDPSSGEEKSPPRRRRMRWVYWTAAVLVPVVGVFGFRQIAYSEPVDAEPDPAEYLKAGTVIDIGVNGKLPGWSKDEGGHSYSGFDIKFAYALAEEFDFTPNFVPLDPSERTQALPDRKIGRAGRVKLVVSNFSVTEARKKEVDFAGPYFLDRPGFLISSAQKAPAAGSVPVLCMTRGVTANDFQGEMRTLGLEVQNSDPNIDKCMEKLVNPSSPVVAVATDYTILTAYLENDPASYPRNTFRVIESLVRLEYSGIGLPNHSPKLCKRVSEFIDKFIRSSWDDVFGDELAEYGLGPDGRKPVHTDMAHCNETA